MRSWVRLSVGGLVLGVAVLAARPALACGGTFCDQAPPGQPPMPVDQTGENVLFVMSGGYVEAHIQIQYQGDPAKFAWVIPIPKAPELFVGSQQLFTNLLNATVPTFQLTTTFQFCDSGGNDTGSSAGCGMSSSDSASAGGKYSPTNDVPKTNAPTVLSRDTVGNFQTVTLEPTDAQGLLDWLVQNGFEPDSADAKPVIQDYVSRGYVFVAVKLQPDVGVDEIHPLVIRYPGDEPCVPLMLTRIAAVEDMTVRVFFLGEDRVVPTGGYKHVTLNPVQLDWLNLGQNYNLAIARAVDSPLANGRAFVTEYAGVSAVVSKTELFSSSWSAIPYQTAAPAAVPNILTGQGLLQCAGSTCQAAHPMVFPLLARYLPPPLGVGASQFYSCTSCYPNADYSAWDGIAFAADFDELIVQPGQRATKAVSQNPYLTRMVTRISPSEMTEDPIFHASAQLLPDVSNLLSSTSTNKCDGGTLVTASDGRQVEGLTAPADLPVEMPWAETVEEFSASGEQTVLADNGKKIDSLLASYNAVNDPPDSVDVGKNQDSASAACGCRFPGRGATPGLALSLLGALGLLRRVRRRQR